jgi:hypothetical protein
MTAIRQELPHLDFGRTEQRIGVPVFDGVEIDDVRAGGRGLLRAIAELFEARVTELKIHFLHFHAARIDHHGLQRERSKIARPIALALLGVHQ